MAGMGPMHMEMMPPPAMAGIDADMMGNMRLMHEWYVTSNGAYATRSMAVLMAP